MVFIVMTTTHEIHNKGDEGPEAGTKTSNKDGPCKRPQTPKSMTRENKVTQGRAKVDVGASWGYPHLALSSQ